MNETGKRIWMEQHGSFTNDPHRITDGRYWVKWRTKSGTVVTAAGDNVGDAYCNLFDKIKETLLYRCMYEF